MLKTVEMFSKGGHTAKLFIFSLALVGYSVLLLLLNNRNLTHYAEEEATIATKSRGAVTSALNSSSSAAYNNLRTTNHNKTHTHSSSLYSNETNLQQHEIVVLSDHQSHVEEKYLIYFTHSGFSNQILGVQRAAQIAYASKRTLVLPPVLPHHTFNRDFLKYPKFEAEVGGQCDKEHWIHYYLKLSNESVDYPSFQALFNFDSISKKTNGLKVIDIQEFSRLKHVNATDFSKWCVDIHKEDSTCNYPKSSTVYFEVLDALQEKCKETQIAALDQDFRFVRLRMLRKLPILMSLNLTLIRLN